MNTCCSSSYHCPVEATLDLIGGKYKSLILWHLIGKTLRFSEIRALIPQATPKMLTQQLRLLEEDCVSKDTIPNCRLLSYMTIPPEGSIGEHEHVEETECYVIKSGKGVVIDNGKKIDISAGDVVITGNGDVHSVINTENEDLEILAFIVLN